MIETYNELKYAFADQVTHLKVWMVCFETLEGEKFFKGDMNAEEAVDFASEILEIHSGVKVFLTMEMERLKKAEPLVFEVSSNAKEEKNENLLHSSEESS